MFKLSYIFLKIINIMNIQYRFQGKPCCSLCNDLREIHFENLRYIYAVFLVSNYFHTFYRIKMLY